MKWYTATASAMKPQDRFQIWMTLFLAFVFSVIIMGSILAGSQLIPNAMFNAAGITGTVYLYRKWKHRNDFDLALIEWEQELNEWQAEKNTD